MKKKNESISAQNRLMEITGILHKHNIIAGITPEKLVSILEDLGPTFIKLGQILSMQPSLPVEYCKKLSKLRANVAPMDFGEIEMILEREYGPDWKKTFVSVDKKPLGSASIAQVHVAKLEGGKVVVLKIQRPGIYDKMANDILLLRKAISVIKYTSIGSTVDFAALIDEMWVVTKQEMNFLIEAENAKELAKNNSDIAYVACPEIVDRYTTSKVLVMEYIEGIYIDNLTKLKESGYDLDEIAGKLANNYVKQIIEDGFFHADPHCGNIIVRDGKIVWIDLGMMGRLSQYDRKLFSQAIEAIVENDIPKLKDFVLSIGKYEGKINQAKLCDDLEALLLKFGSLDFKSMDLAQLSDNLMMILTNYGISVPKGMSMLGRSMATIQGTLRTVSENINFVEILASYMSNQYLKDMDIKKELARTLKSLHHSSKDLLNIPTYLADALKSFTKGYSKINMEITMSDDMNEKIERLIKKLVISIITAALLVGSSLICTTGMRPQILGIPAIGFIGFLVSALMGIWLLIFPLKKRKK